MHYNMELWVRQMMNWMQYALYHGVIDEVYALNAVCTITGNYEVSGLNVACTITWSFGWGICLECCIHYNKELLIGYLLWMQHALQHRVIDQVSALNAVCTIIGSYWLGIWPECSMHYNMEFWMRYMSWMRSCVTLHVWCSTFLSL